ncbi:pyridoxamine 5'-phosphate oxidase family protein [Actinomadura sp. 9N407]|uniref:pyridoxamine 5'-phosphate oxidase family protein n=1 Tax=Actinomadura sp. 9N407 TaxID=3375154 RepID=UPI0037AF40CB
MTRLAAVAPSFVSMAHEIVWCTVSTVDGKGRPRSRILHPIWVWENDELVGWVGTTPTPAKRAHLEQSPYVACNYWSPSHDTALAECKAEWAFDDETRTKVWDLFINAPEPVGYDPAIVPTWGGPTKPSFAALRLTPWRLRVFPGTVLMGQGGEILTWTAEEQAQ